MRRFAQGVPYGADQTIYLVVEGSGPEGNARQTERTDLDTVITDLLSGQFADPIEVVATSKGTIYLSTWMSSWAELLPDLRLKLLGGQENELGLLEYVLVAGRQPGLVHDDRVAS